MKEHYDPWFVRLPDGRVLNAKSTASVRHHVEAGNIPLNSKARRNADSEWAALSKIPEFADLTVPGGRSTPSVYDLAPGQSENGSATDTPSGVSARLDPLRLQTVGIRGLVDELIAAFDSTINSRKLVVAGLAGVTMLLSTFIIDKSFSSINNGTHWLTYLIAVPLDFFILAAVVAVLSRQTHLELSRMKPVTIDEASQRIVPLVFRVFIGYVLTIGVGVGLWVLFDRVPHWLADWTASQGAAFSEFVLTFGAIVSLILVLVIAHMIVLSSLVAPILVVEECSVGDALREWRALIKEHRVRVLVYEGMALALALIAALPVALPVYFALTLGPSINLIQPNWMMGAARAGMVGLAIGPAIAFLTIANLFIYLNLRYEYTTQK